MLLGSIAESHGARPLGIAHLGRRHAAWTHEGCGHMLRLAGTQPCLRRAAWAHSRPGHSTQPRKARRPWAHASSGALRASPSWEAACRAGHPPRSPPLRPSPFPPFATPALPFAPSSRTLLPHPPSPACAMALSFDGVGGAWRFSFGIAGKPWRRPPGNGAGQVPHALGRTAGSSEGRDVSRETFVLVLTKNTPSRNFWQLGIRLLQRLPHPCHKRRTGTR